MTPFRIAIGGLSHEANTFSEFAVTRENFEHVWLREGADLLHDAPLSGMETGGAIALLSECGDVDLLPLIDAACCAGGLIRQDVYEVFRDRLLHLLEQALPVDGVLLALHGAGMSEDQADIEAEILGAVRDLVGPRAVIAVAMDLHGNVTRPMVELADLLVAYRHYPHDDTVETGRRSADLLIRTLRGDIRPTMSAVKLPVIAACQNQNTRTGGPLTDLNAQITAMERSGQILSGSYFTVQHGIDRPDTSLAMVVITDSAPGVAVETAQDLARFAWDNRHRFRVSFELPEQAIRRGLELAGGPVVLSEASDCVGGGSFGDSALMVQALRDHAPDATACILITDPASAEQAIAAGIGARFEAQIGNGLSSWFGTPVQGEVEVVALSDGHFTYDGGCYDKVAFSMGPSAHVRLGAIDILLASIPTYEHGAEQFAALGINPWERKFVVVKNPMNFQQFYGTAPLRIHLDTPGPTDNDVALPLWQNLTRPIYPLDDDFDPTFAVF